MLPCSHSPSALPALYMHWNIVLTPSTQGLHPDRDEALNVLPGDTIIFTGAPALVTFPAGTTTPESGPVPGTFQVNALADEGCYAYRIEAPSGGSAPPTPPFQPRIHIGLVCLDTEDNGSDFLHPTFPDTQHTARRDAA